MGNVDFTDKPDYNLVTMNRICPRLIAVFSMSAILAGVGPLYAQSPIKLAYSYKPGSTLKYRIKQRMTGTRQITGTDPMQMDVELTSVIRMKCTKVLPNGGWEVAVDTEDEWMKISGKAVYGYRPPKEVRTVQIMPSGRCVVQPDQKDPAPRRPRSVDFGNVESILLMTILPDAPVAVGGAWSAEMPLSIDATSTLKLAFKLEEIRVVNSARLGVIKQVLSTPPGQPDEASGGGRGSQSGEVTVLFDMEQGRLCAAQGAIRTQVMTPIQVPAAPGTQSQSQAYQTMDLTSNLTVELLPENAAQPTPPGS